jgi:hypothetical protein
MQVEDFARSYETKTNEELLRLSLDSEQLTSEATAALAYPKTIPCVLFVS